MEGLIMAAQLILGLSILVGLHELGHLVAAKFFGMRVEQYYIGFPPKIFGFRYGETEYNLGAVPLGGFVKISGMVDESLDTKNLSEEPEPWEFRAKPAWQRLIVMMGGIIINVITGIVIFVVMAYAYGESYLPKREVMKYGIVANNLGKELGFETGDKIVSVNGHDYQKFNELTSANVLLEDNSYYTVERDGKLVDISIPANFLDRLSDKEESGSFISLRIPAPFEVSQVAEDSPAEAAGLHTGDQIVQVNGKDVAFFDQMQKELAAHKNGDVQLTILKAGSQGVEHAPKATENLDVKVTDEGTLGFGVRPLWEIDTTTFSFGESIKVGTEDAFNAVWVNIRALGKVFSGDVSASKSFSGPIGIAQIFGGTWDWYRFWKIVGLLSMVLAFMNFLPIPALDGGHVAFLTYEIVSGRKPSDRFLEGAQKVGMVLLLTLMTFVIFNDIFKLIF